VKASVVIVRLGHGDMVVECSTPSRAWAIARMATRDWRSGGKWVRVGAADPADEPVRILAAGIDDIRVEQDAATSTAHDHQAAASLDDRAERLQGQVFTGLGEVIDLVELVNG
jgi:hypothetical protein